MRTTGGSRTQWLHPLPHRDLGAQVYVHLPVTVCSRLKRTPANCFYVKKKPTRVEVPAQRGLGTRRYTPGISNAWP